VFRGPRSSWGNVDTNFLLAAPDKECGEEAGIGQVGEGVACVLGRGVAPLWHEKVDDHEDVLQEMQPYIAGDSKLRAKARKRWQQLQDEEHVGPGGTKSSLTGQTRTRPLSRSLSSLQPLRRATTSQNRTRPLPTMTIGGTDELEARARGKHRLAGPRLTTGTGDSDSVKLDMTKGFRPKDNVVLNALGFSTEFQNMLRPGSRELARLNEQPRVRPKYDVFAGMSPDLQWKRYPGRTLDLTRPQPEVLQKNVRHREQVDRGADLDSNTQPTMY